MVKGDRKDCRLGWRVYDSTLRLLARKGVCMHDVHE